MGGGKNLGAFEEILLLAVAGVGGRGHGAAIHEAILDATRRDVSIPAVYVTLARLEKKGLVRTGVELADAEAGGRARKTFAITDAGIAELREARLVQERLWQGLDFDPVGAEE
jgi:PadR family transcriptional regulator PadR